ncbi:FixH family protein [Roseivivax isoporae]|uniref:YtkA-like domain-containing protein n=1 Tax=Roseivivax isoporae LMG 25204 TaxID=1449351 RepID=X7FG58_9RHOB|nr:FixH family protein [Roseivivax isoporae]ETX31011.1 hypothetical protein RISW2_00040 [Roseivivax isoporae LMG 25204]
MMKTFTATALALSLAAPALAADRLEAVADCVPTDAALSYDCTIELSRNGAPVEDAVFTVAPDMPSMPMAHNIAPVPAEAGDAPGSYTVPLTLDMHGRWALRLEVSAPARDMVVVTHDFDAE